MLTMREVATRHHRLASLEWAQYEAALESRDAKRERDAFAASSYHSKMGRASDEVANGRGEMPDVRYRRRST